MVNYYLKERHIGGLADRLWRSVGNIKLLPRAKMLLDLMNFFLQQVDYE